MARFLYKPIGQGQLGGGRATLLLDEDQGLQYNAASIYTSDGQFVERLSMNRGRPEGGAAPAVKFWGSKPGAAYGENFIVRVEDSSGKKTDYTIGSGAQRYTGEMGNPSSLAVDTSRGSGGGGSAGGFTPGQVGEFGYYPAYLGDEFPSPVMLKRAPYNFTDPMAFAEKFGEFNRGEIRKNYDLANELALKELDTELEGLQNFVPAASALKRSQVSIDNLFNQRERTAQLLGTMPEVFGQLDAQGRRAEAYAAGRAPDEVTDRALELGIRSSAADRASAGGFGATSSVARKASDLMSATQRIQLSQYGDQLLTSNIGTKNQILMAPTEYSDAGTQVKVTPALSGSQLAAANLSEINNQSLVSTTNALTNQTQQKQFLTNLKQQTRMFNTQTKNQFALTEFGYKVGYAGTVAGAAQTNANTELALAMQAQSSSIFQDYLNQAQQQGTYSSIAQFLSALPSIISSFSDIFKEDTNTNTPSQTTTPGSTPGSDSSGGVQPNDFGVTNDDVDNNYDPSTDENTAPLEEGDSFAYPDEPAPSADPNAEAPPAFDSSPEVDAGTTYALSSARSFTNDTGISASLANDPQQPVTKALMASGSNALKAAGMSYTQQQGYLLAGYDTAGKAVYSSPQVASVQSPDIGMHAASAFSNSIRSMNVLNDQDASTLSKIQAVAGDASFITQLTGYVANKDAKGFVNALLGRVGPSIAKDLLLTEGMSKADRQRVSENINTAFAAYSLYANWDRMSTGQKALGLAYIGFNAFRDSTGKRLSQIAIKSPVYNSRGQLVSPGFNMGQALNLIGTGMNAHSLIKNWDQMNTLQRIAAGTGTVADIANTAKALNLFGTGANGAAVSAQGLAQVNTLMESGAAVAAPHVGNGAIALNAGTSLPEGYSVIANEGGKVIAAPTSTLGSVAQGLSQVAGVASIAMGAKQVYDGWGQGGVKGRKNGITGGASIAGGLYALGYSNPYLLAGVVAFSVISNSIKTGKSGAQLERDGARKMFQAAGVTDGGDIALADGTIADIDIDGHGGYHKARYTDKLLEGADGSALKGGKGTLQAFDIDYTNDLDYVSGMGGMALSKLLAGGGGRGIEQVGGQVGNAALGKVGFGADMTEENFNIVMGNLRGIYAKAGIKSKQDAYQLANQALAEGRITESECVTMHQSFNMMYDKDSYKGAQNLMAGRWSGIREAAAQADVPENPESKQAISQAKESKAEETGEKPVQRGAGRQRPPLFDQSKAPVGKAKKPIAPKNIRDMPVSFPESARYSEGEKKTKEQAREFNRQRYTKLNGQAVTMGGYA